jgi:hypothetical protein
MALLVACDQAEPVTQSSPKPESHVALTARIEAAVTTILPDITVRQYARHYIEKADGHILGVYVRKCREGTPVCAEAKPVWTSKEQFPTVLDGGCDAINVEYDPEADTVLTAACNDDL